MIRAWFVAALVASAAGHGFMGFGVIVHGSAKEQWLVVQLVIPNGPADRAGIKPGDVITRMNGKPIAFADPIAVLDDFAARRPGERVSFNIGAEPEAARRDRRRRRDERAGLRALAADARGTAHAAQNDLRNG